MGAQDFTERDESDSGMLAMDSVFAVVDSGGFKNEIEKLG